MELCRSDGEDWMGGWVQYWVQCDCLKKDDCDGGDDDAGENKDCWMVEMELLDSDWPNQEKFVID